MRAEQLARHSEAVRSALNAKWRGDAFKETWKTRCQIVLHTNRQAYVNAVGRGGERTLGSSVVNVVGGRIVSRRIDLLATSDFLSAALPHELTHIVLKDGFEATTVPLWADEGAAILADPQAKQRRHHTDLALALARGTAFRAAELLTQDQHPNPRLIGAFYGQSASLAAYLIDRAGHMQFVKFLEQATGQGYDVALRKSYGIDGVSELDRLWRQQMIRMAGGAKPTS